MDHNLPTDRPGRRGIAETLVLVDDLRRLAHDTTLEPADALRRIRDAFQDYDDHEGGAVGPFA